MTQPMRYFIALITALLPVPLTTLNVAELKLVGVDQHPRELSDPTPVVDFIQKHCR